LKPVPQENHIFFQVFTAQREEKWPIHSAKNFNWHKAKAVRKKSRKQSSKKAVGTPGPNFLCSEQNK
jgi:hypothetical protein